MMDILISVSFVLLFVLIIVLPFVFYKYFFKSLFKNNLMMFFGVSFTVLMLIMLFFAWYSNWSTIYLLESYGYNFKGNGSEELFRAVKDADLERVYELENSLMGIDWQMKAFLALPVGFVYVAGLSVVLFFRMKRIQ